MCISTPTGAVLEQPSPTTEIFLSNTTAVPSPQAQLSLQRMIPYSSATSRVAPGPDHPERGAPIPRRCSTYLARWVDSCDCILYPNMPISVADSLRDGANELEIARNPHGSHTSQSTRLACAREAGGALVVPAAHSAAREASALRAGSRRGRSRTPHVDRDDCDDYKYQHEGDTNGGRWRGGEGEPGLLKPPRRCLRSASQVSQRLGCGFRRGEGEGANVGGVVRAGAGHSRSLGWGVYEP
ncbi:hypothetical protein DFH08DRAFT_797208 [Mycena albidolilacea]|uniref:Uncharacterized protein n=1 Tax=Mycena albidolilacea TaxID=1033008 RepID=A0AAD7AR28_9AGAR|nr:hypothetical protein DFH08DRAFT_797208 [Mycena albidolilacea]